VHQTKNLINIECDLTRTARAGAKVREKTNLRNFNLNGKSFLIPFSGVNLKNITSSIPKNINHKFSINFCPTDFYESFFFKYCD